jgi:hypothetical protein
MLLYPISLHVLRGEKADESLGGRDSGHWS